VGVRLVSGGAGESVTLGAGQRVRGERWHVRLGSSKDLPRMLERYAEKLPSRPAHHRAPPTLGWNSWYQLFSRVDEQAVRENARQVKKVFAGRGALEPTVVIDDGWEPCWGDWTARRDKFPSGMARLARDLKAKGVSPGIWLAPFLANVKARVVKEHPEWFVKNHVFKHPTGRYRVLDVTHPGAAAHLATTVKGLVGAGYETLKIDFLAHGSVEGKRHETTTGMQAYHRGMQIIRRAAGPKTRLIASGAPGVATFRYADAWRVSQDVAWPLPSAWLGPTWPEVVGLARNLGARWFLHPATGLDTDPLLLRGWRDKSKPHAASWLAAFGGHGLHLSDDLRRLSPGRLVPARDRARLKAAMSGVASRPETLIPPRVPRTLGRQVSLLGRLLGFHRVKAPEVWRTPGGKQVRIDLRSVPGRWLRRR
jgi:alpha-galactosidase